MEPGVCAGSYHEGAKEFWIRFAQHPVRAGLGRRVEISRKKKS
jgi:hypothetical protein